MALSPRFVAAVLLILAMSHGGCVSSGPGTRTPDLLLQPQSSGLYQCGPTTLASVLSFHGVSVPEEKISERIYSPTARGVLLMDLARVARDNGFSTTTRNGTVDDLRQTLAAGNPPIVLIDRGAIGIRIPHFSAVTGITENGVFLIGTRPENDFLSHPLFARQWKLAGNQYLVLSPLSPPSL